MSAMLVSAAVAADGEASSTLADQQGVAVTIYNDNLALIKDQRKIQLGSGQGTLAFRDVSAQMRPETALLRSLSSPGKLSVVEQNFDFDLLTPQKMLDKYVGKTVTVIKTNSATGAESSEQAQVLATNNGVVLKFDNRIETGVPGRIAYGDVPANLRDRPTLVMQLNNAGATRQDVELSYLSGGLGWKADYVAELNATDDKLDLSGWVTLTNTSGASYRNARLQLVAGNVNQVTPVRSRMVMAEERMAPLPAPAPPRPMAEESLLEYHLYTLDHPTTIAENQTKQVALLSATDVPVRKELLLSGAGYYYSSSYGELGQKLKTSVFIEFDNKENANLGMPLPKGILRVYKKDSAGNAQFVGEDNIDHTPRNEKVRLKLGDSFDVTAAKKQTEFKKLPNPAQNSTQNPVKGSSIFESAYEIVLKNARKESVTVTVQEPIPGDWKMLESNHKHEKPTSNTAVWHIKVPAEGETKLTYRVQVRY